MSNYNLSENDFYTIFPNAIKEYIDKFFDSQDLLSKYEVTTPLRIIHFLAQCGEETGGFAGLVETGSAHQWDTYQNHPGLGNTQSGDGYRYRGRGCIQLTGRDNYRWIGGIVGKDYENDPDSVSDIENAWLSALGFWKGMKLNYYADQDDIRTITKKINGGLNGYDTRVMYLNKLKKIWGL